MRKIPVNYNELKATCVELNKKNDELEGKFNKSNKMLLAANNTILEIAMLSIKLKTMSDKIINHHKREKIFYKFLFWCIALANIISFAWKVVHQ